MSAGTPAPTAVPTGATDLGGMNLDRYCQSLGDIGASLDGITASDWHCVDSQGVHMPINMTALCAWQYPSATNPVAYAGAQSNPYSWQCYSLSTTITRTIAYTYDGLQRLAGAVESP
ncbi:MAG: hypothetical protein ACRDIE_11715, partial [Chloroflexota bacterium]